MLKKPKLYQKRQQIRANLFFMDFISKRQLGQ
uniref:Uncharacterized protein n=1 Tax=Nymphaea colorata TaxID=210225 RepID=A0A5K1CP17_9MAGN